MFMPFIRCLYYVMLHKLRNDYRARCFPGRPVETARYSNSSGQHVPVILLNLRALGNTLLPTIGKNVVCWLIQKTTKSSTEVSYFATEVSSEEWHCISISRHLFLGHVSLHKITKITTIVQLKARLCALMNRDFLMQHHRILEIQEPQNRLAKDYFKQPTQS